MKINPEKLNDFNKNLQNQHQRDLEHLTEKLSKQNIDIESLIKKVQKFQIAVPSWALGTGSTRFGRFPGGGEPFSVEEKIDDVGILHHLTRQTDSVSLHIPWDLPKDPQALKEHATNLGLGFDAMNSNTFQDTKDFANANRKLSYKFGSLCHSDTETREQAIEHNIETIELGQKLGSKAITIWLGDGTNYPGQANFRKQFENVLSSLRRIHNALPEDWKMFTEHKPFEPAFYSSVVNDWGSSLLLAQQTGEKCLSLVDLGHHLPNANIEQIVSRLLMEGKLAGFHFNDSKYGDDDLTVGSLKPYQLFLIFIELVEFLEGDSIQNPELAWMIDASHNVKDPLLDLMQSLEAIALAYTQSLLVPRQSLEAAQESNDVIEAQELLQNAYRTDVRPILAEARVRNNGAIAPIQAYRNLKVREELIKERGYKTESNAL